MIRTVLIAVLLTAIPISASAAPLLGDFECLSDLGGPDTYHGTLRVEEPAQFGFLSEAATVDAWFPLDISDPDAVVFDEAFAQQISAGATMVSARVLEDDFAYEARIRTSRGEEVSVHCVYVY